MQPLNLEPIKARINAADFGRYVLYDDPAGAAERAVSEIQKHALADIPLLVAEVERLRAVVAGKQTVIDEVAEQFYADEVDTAAIADALIPEASDGHTVQLVVYSTPAPAAG
jgi:hypothetical protein